MALMTSYNETTRSAAERSNSVDKSAVDGGYSTKSELAESELVAAVICAADEDEVSNFECGAFMLVALL